MCTHTLLRLVHFDLSREKPLALRMMEKFQQSPNTVEWDGRVYMNVTWMNLTNCTKIVLMTCILNMIHPEHSAGMIFQYLNMSEGERKDWFELCEKNGLFSNIEEVQKQHESVAIAKLNAQSLKYLEAVGDNSTWMTQFLKAQSEYKTPSFGPKYTVTQEEMDTAKRFVLSRQQGHRPFAIDLMRRLDLFVGQTFNLEPELPAIFNQIRRPAPVEEFPDPLKHKRAYLARS